MIRSARIGRLWAMIVKEMLAALRDPRARITLVVPPILQLVLFGFASTLEVKNIEIGVYDRDGGVWAREFVQRLSGSPNVSRIVPIASPAELRHAINSREVIAALVFDQGFSADVAAGRTATVGAVLDGRRSNAAQIVAGYLDRIAAGIGADMRPQARPPGGSIVTHWFNPNLDNLWFVMPALLVVIGSVSAMAVSGQSIARERELGTFDQLMVSPLRVHEILIGKMVPPVVIGLVNGTLFVIAIPLLFGVPLMGSVPLLYLGLTLYLLALTGVGLLVSTLAQTQQQAFLFMFLVVVPAILLSGYASPIDNMPGWLQTLAEANPAQHFLIVAEGVFLKGAPASALLTHIWPLTVISAVTLAASALLFRSRMD